MQGALIVSQAFMGLLLQTFSWGQAISIAGRCRSWLALPYGKYMVSLLASTN